MSQYQNQYQIQNQSQNQNQNQNQNQSQSQNKFKMDNCYISAQNNDNNSIFNYMTDKNMYINKNECFDSTPPFLNYIPNGVPRQNVDIENDLRGAKRNNSKCASCKWNPQYPELAGNVYGVLNQNNKPVCENHIIKDGKYYNKQ